MKEPQEIPDEEHEQVTANGACSPNWQPSASMSAA